MVDKASVLLMSEFVHVQVDHGQLVIPLLFGGNARLGFQLLGS